MPSDPSLRRSDRWARARDGSRGAGNSSGVPVLPLPAYYREDTPTECGNPTHALFGVRFSDFSLKPDGIHWDSKVSASICLYPILLAFPYWKNHGFLTGGVCFDGFAHVVSPFLQGILR
jgi:hypothetical protein